ncbi:MAG: lipoate--protein ligase family protein [Acidimicrobiia bacterium]|jgi:lipoate-protein ligase A
MASRRVIRVLDDLPAAPSPLDIGAADALLQRASDGEVPETFQLAVPGRVVAFGRRDRLETGYPAAIAAAHDAGFAAIERIAGGRAAAFTEATLSFTWTIPDPDPRVGIRARFAALSSLMVGAFARLGIEAAVGEVPGEYCPGEFSVHHDGRLKLMGVGQRLARRAAHVGGVVVVDRADLVRDVLTGVYAALEIPWRPETTGSLAVVQPGVTVEATRRAVLDELAQWAELRPGVIDAETLALGAALAPRHLATAR